MFVVDAPWRFAKGHFYVFMMNIEFICVGKKLRREQVNVSELECELEDRSKVTGPSIDQLKNGSIKFVFFEGIGYQVVKVERVIGKLVVHLSVF